MDLISFAASAQMVKGELARVTEAAQSADPLGLRLSKLAAFYAALISDEVHLIHNAGVKVLEAKKNQSRLEFFKAIEKDIQQLEETTR